MKQYPKELINRVRRNINVVDIISRYVELKKYGGKYIGLCPFHDDKKPSFTVFPNTGKYCCFGCGAKGDIFDFIQYIEKTDFKCAFEKLSAECGIELPKHVSIKNDETEQILAVNNAAERFFQQNLFSNSEKAVEYIKERCITNETSQKFGIGYAPNDQDIFLSEMYRQYISKNDLLKAGLIYVDTRHGGKANCRFANRITIPIKNYNGEIIGFAGRYIGEANNCPKYLNSPETGLFKKSKTIFGLDIAKRSSSDYFILCEGFFDVISLHQNGYDNAVAPMGTALTSEQAQLLKRFKNNVIIVFDSDTAGKSAAEKAANILKNAGIETRIAILNQYKDPDEAMKNDKSAFDEAISEAMSHTMLLLNRCLEALGENHNADARYKCAETCARIISKLDSDLELEIYAQYISTRLHVSANSIIDAAKKLSVTQQ